MRRISFDTQPIGAAVVGTGRWTLSEATPSRVTIEAGAEVELIIENQPTELQLTLERDARLRVVHVITEAGVPSSLGVNLRENAECRVAQVITAATESGVEVSLAGSGASFELGGVFLLSGDQRCGVRVDVRHDVSDCRSRTLYKGVASGSARGEFSGIVYVAPDAQRTDSEQLSRNITMADAHIATRPQLEIYADDVRCSHGATVGQLDDQAVLYMRQRGLSLEMAKRLQIEGFVSDVVLHAPIAECCETLVEILHEKLQSL